MKAPYTTRASEAALDYLDHIQSFEFAFVRKSWSAGTILMLSMI